MIYNVSAVYLIIKLLPNGSRWPKHYHVVYELEGRRGLYIKMFNNSELSGFSYIKVKFDHEVVEKIE